MLFIPINNFIKVCNFLYSIFFHKLLVWFINQNYILFLHYFLLCLKLHQWADCLRVIPVVHSSVAPPFKAPALKVFWQTNIYNSLTAGWGTALAFVTAWRKPFQDQPRSCSLDLSLRLGAYIQQHVFSCPIDCPFTSHLFCSLKGTEGALFL